MSNDNTFSGSTLDELTKEQKRLRTLEITSAVVIGFLFGVMVYGLVKNGFGWVYTIIPLFLIAGIARNSQNLRNKLKLVREEIQRRSPDR